MYCTYYEDHYTAVREQSRWMVMGGTDRSFVGQAIYLLYSSRTNAYRYVRYPHCTEYDASVCSVDLVPALVVVRVLDLVLVLAPLPMLVRVGLP
jgi:hypothetical protein